MAGPIVAAAVRPATVSSRSPFARLSAEELIAQIDRYEAASAGNSYALGACLQELSQPKRYKEELGFAKFDELLSARKLPSRMTAFKLIAVVTTYSEPEVRQLGGMEKSYALVRFAKRATGLHSDPRRFLTLNTFLGKAFAKVTTRDINNAISGSTGDEAGAELNAAARKAAKRASAKLGHALKRAGLKHRMRVHDHNDDCVSAHFDPATATTLAALLSKLRKLEKLEKKTKKPT